jgi:hypothetical protein
VVSKENMPNMLPVHMGEIIYELNNNINANNFPEFVYSEDILAKPDELKKNNIIALLSKDDPVA